MRIEELVLHGFKSFAERTVLPMLPGVTAVVGPNGSGKSNLVEAIRFASGTRTLRLRGGAPEDLVFQGAPGRRPAGFAEVRLRLLGERRVELVRRLYRDGRQEVRLDGRRASLKELSLALAGTGLGPGGGAVIGQGQVAGVLEAPPERLRAYLVEAAGLAEVEARIQEAEAKLGQARARLEEEASRLAELARARVRLEEEARAARRARELEAKRLALRRGLLAARLEEAKRAAGEARTRAGLARKAAEAARTEAAFARKEADLLARRHQALREHESLLLELRSALAAEARGLRERIRLLEENLALLLRREQELAGKLRSLPQRPEEPAPDADLKAIEARLRELKARQKALRAELAAAERAHRRYLEALARYQAAQAAYEATLKERRKEAQRLWALEAELAEKLPRLLALRREAERLEEAIQRLEAKRQAKTAELAALIAEQERLARAVEEGRGLAEGPRRLLRAGLPGVVGAVAGLLDFPPELKEAAEAALGGRLGWIVVEDEAALKAAVAWLKVQGLRATLLARTLARPPEERPVPTCPGILGRLREWVRFDDPRLTRTVVGETLLAENLDAALLCFKRHPRRIVTRDGTLLEPSGAVSGGRARRHGLLEAPARLAELEGEAKRLRHELMGLEAKLKDLRAKRPDVGNLAQEVAEIWEELAVLHRSLARPLAEPGAPPEPVPEPDWEALLRLEEAITALEAERARAEAWARFRAGEAERPTIEAELEATRKQRAEAEARLARLKEARDALKARAAQVEAALKEVRAALGELARAHERRLLDEARAREAAERAQAEAEAAELEAARKEAQAEAIAEELKGLPPGPAAPGGMARLRAVERELASLGPVNFRAEVELEALLEKIEAQKARLEEAQAAHDRLKAFLGGLKGDFDRRLAEAERRLQAAFAHYVRALLGGEGKLLRKDGGLTLELAPAGKRVRALGLLSTGEKTMGALSLLFALAEVREGGLPIAVLDEVDAALDEANLARFVRFLKGFKKGRQVLIVTHQKRTLEAADAVFGVTHVEGVSRVYTLRRGEAE